MADSVGDVNGEEVGDTENLTDGFNLVVDALKLNDIQRTRHSHNRSRPYDAGFWDEDTFV